MAAEDKPRDSATALGRFGLGARPGERAAVSNDPRGFVLAQISNRTSAALPDALLASSTIVVEVNRYLAATRAERDRREHGGSRRQRLE